MRKKKFKPESIEQLVQELREEAAKLEKVVKGMRESGVRIVEVDGANKWKRGISEVRGFTKNTRVGLIKG